MPLHDIFAAIGWGLVFVIGGAAALFTGMGLGEYFLR
jgi:hypothetical protein